MSQRADKTTSLWAVIEGMQERLEDLGLDSEVVDATVTQRLAQLVDDSPAAAERRDERSFWSLFRIAPAQA